MGKPAATLGSMHICPKVTSKVPHVGGPVLAGSPNVTIGGLSAARKGDKLLCVGPPDTISQGSGSVFINGKPAARMGDATKHGGKLIMGNASVLIGDKFRAAKRPAPVTYKAAIKRMDEAQLYIDAAHKAGASLPASAYSTIDKQGLVEKELDERFLFRIIESKHANDTDYIGPPTRSAIRRFWSCSFTQAEHGGREPEALCKAAGRAYDPTCDYTVLLIDHRKAAEIGDMLSFTPTYKNTADKTKILLGSEFSDQLDLIEPCLTPEFSRYYENVKISAEETGTEFEEQEDFAEYCQTLGFTPSQAKVLAVRYQIEQALGANHEFLGNGLTKNLNEEYDSTPFGDIDESLEYGPPELLTWDKNPLTLGILEKAGAIKRINIGNGIKNEKI